MVFRENASVDDGDKTRRSFSLFRVPMYTAACADWTAILCCSFFRVATSLCFMWARCVAVDAQLDVFINYHTCAVSTNQ